MKKTLYILFLTFVVASCRPQTEAENQTYSKTFENKTIGEGQLKSVQNILEVGHEVFKKNCAVCHCEPLANCEPTEHPRLLDKFINLPKGSLASYISLVKSDSNHKFNKTLPDSLVETVIQYIWLTSKPEFRN